MAPDAAAYRADIDGLRAVRGDPGDPVPRGRARLLGGFVGVDVFFVISGFLITGILARDMAAGRHSIAAFCRGRVLRIFPALLVVTAALLLPVERDRYAGALAGTAPFASNAVFYARTDYLDLGAVSQPLLHTWSFAVEEQWYLIWPPILAAIGPCRPRAALALRAASLAIAVRWLPPDPAAAFYLIPAQGWEPGVGAAPALARPRAMAARRAALCAAAGLAAILASVKFYTAEAPFPGLAALPPCLGAALLIQAGRPPIRWRARWRRRRCARSG